MWWKSECFLLPDLFLVYFQIFDLWEYALVFVPIDDRRVDFSPNLASVTSGITVVLPVVPAGTHAVILFGSKSKDKEENPCA
jgi:hypothetical protein